MARIGEYTQQIFLDRANPSNVDAAGGVFMSRAQEANFDADRFERRGRAMSEFGQTIQNQRNIQGELRAREIANQKQREAIARQKEMESLRMTSPDGFAKEQDDWFRNMAAQTEEEILSKDDGQPFDVTMFRQIMDRERTDTFQRNTAWEDGMRVRNISTNVEKTLDAENANFALKNPTFKDLPAHIQKQREYVTTTGAKILDPTQQNKLASYAVDKAAIAVMDNLAHNNPKSLRNVVLYGAGEKNQLIDFVFDIEGNDKIAKEPDDAIAKYGINSLAYAKRYKMTHEAAKEKIAKLTEDEAREELSKFYWDKRLDAMPPAMRAVAFDALVNHGNDKNTWDMIERAQGNPEALLQIRKDYYAQLVANNPEKNARYQRGWDQRLQELAGYVNDQAAGGQEFLQYASLVNPEIIVRAQGMAKNAVEAKAREEEAQKKVRVAEFQTSYKNAYDTMVSELEPLGLEELDSVMQLAVTSGDDESIARAEALQMTNSYVTTLRGLSNDQIRQVIRRKSAEVNKAPNPMNRLELELAEGVLDQQEKAINEEGLGYWGRTGQIKMPNPINYANPADAVTELRMREQSAAAVAQKTGENMPVLMPDEIEGLKEQWETLPANEMASLLGYFDGLDKSSKARLAQAVDAKSPILSTAISVDDQDTRRKIILGSKIEPKFDKAVFEDNVNAILSDMVVDPEFLVTANQAVSAWYNAQTLEERDDPSQIDPDRIREGIEAIYGKVVDISFMGTNNVFSFRDNSGQFVDDDELYDMFNDLTDDQLVGLFGELPKGMFDEQVTAKDIRDNARIVSSGDGLYNVTFMNTNRAGASVMTGIYDKNGGLLEIDGRKLLELHRKAKK